MLNVNGELTDHLRKEYLERRQHLVNKLGGTGYGIELGPFLLSFMMAGHKIESVLCSLLIVVLRVAGS